MAMNPRLLRPRASGFTPKRLANLSAWYDSSVSSSLFDATTGGSSVASGASVARWEDLSGNSNHMTQSVANNRPTRNASQFNGKDAVRFDGSNDLMLMQSGVPMSSGASIVIVSRKNTNNQGGMHSLRGFISANHHPFNDGNAYDGFASNARFLFAQAYRSDLYVWGVIAGSQWTAYAGTNVLRQGSYTAANQYNNNQQAIGAGGFDGTTGSFYFDGWICEVLIFSRGISASEYTTLYGYLKTKWGAA